MKPWMAFSLRRRQPKFMRQTVAAGAVLHLEQRAFIVLDDRRDHLQLALGLGELQRGLHLVALALQLFLVCGDALGALGRDVFDAVQVLDFLGTGQ